MEAKSVAARRTTVNVARNNEAGSLRCIRNHHKEIAIHHMGIFWVDANATQKT